MLGYKLDDNDQVEAIANKVSTTTAYRSNEGGYSIIHVAIGDDEHSYTNVRAVRDILKTVCTQTSYTAIPIGGFTYEGEYEYIDYTTEVNNLGQLLKVHEIAWLYKETSKSLILDKLEKLTYSTFTIVKEGKYDYMIKKCVGDERGYAVPALIDRVSAVKGEQVTLRLENWNTGYESVTQKGVPAKKYDATPISIKGDIPSVSLIHVQDSKYLSRKMPGRFKDFTLRATMVYRKTGKPAHIK